MKVKKIFHLWGVRRTTLSLPLTDFSLIKFFGARLPLNLDLIPGRDLFTYRNPPSFRRFRRRDRSADALPATVQSGHRHAAPPFEVAKEQLSGHWLDQRRRSSPLLQR